MKDFDKYIMKKQYKEDCSLDGIDFTFEVCEYEADLDGYLNDWKKEFRLTDDDMFEQDFTSLAELFVQHIIITVIKDSKKIGEVSMFYINIEEMACWTSSILNSLNDMSADLFRMMAILYDNGYDYEDDPINQPTIYYIEDMRFETSDTSLIPKTVFDEITYRWGNGDTLYAYFLNVSDENYEKYKHKPTMEEQMAMIIGEKERNAVLAMMFGKADEITEASNELVFDDMQTGLKQVVMSDKQKEYYIKQFYDLDYEKSYPDEAFDSKELELMDRLGFGRIKNTQLMTYEFTDCGECSEPKQ